MIPLSRRQGQYPRSRKASVAAKSMTPGMPPTPPPSSERRRAAKLETALKMKKPKPVLRDTVTTLQPSDLAKSRNMYTAEMKRLNENKKAERYDGTQKDFAKSMICDVPQGIGAPELRACALGIFHLILLSVAVYLRLCSLPECCQSP